MASPKNWKKLQNKKFFESWKNRMRGDIVELEYAGSSWYIDEKPLDGEVNHIFRKGRISYLKKAEIMSGC
jgi:hypothetical protein